MNGDADARFELGLMEYDAGHCNIALQHWVISAKFGQEK